MAEVTCPQCKAINRDTARFCHECGAPLLVSPQKSAAGPGSGGRNGEEAPVLQPDMVLENRYRIEYELGRGGFGAVYKAWDLRLSKPVAVKENLETTAEAKRQFTREARVLANLSHPNLPRVIDHFVIEGQGQYLVMDYVEGEDLLTLLQREGGVPIDRAMEWLAQVVNALDYLHSQEPPVLHRDIKPSNIRITPRGKAMLVDFGLVKVSDSHLKTTVGARAITPGYAPPEQYGTGTTDPRTDIYALGATMYRVVTGREPPESVQRMTGEYLVPAHLVDPRISPQLSQVVERAMALDPAQRYQNAAEFERDLRASLTTPIPDRSTPTIAAAPDSRPPSAQQQPTPPPRREPEGRPAEQKSYETAMIDKPEAPPEVSVQPVAATFVSPVAAPARPGPAATVVARPASQPPAAGTVRAPTRGRPLEAAPGQKRGSGRTLLWIGLGALAVLCLGVIGLGALMMGSGQMFSDTTATAQLLGSKVAEALATSTAQAAQSTDQFNVNAASTTNTAATAQANAKATSTAAQVTANAVARWTSVAQTAEASKQAPTQTAMAWGNYVNGLLANKKLVVGPKSGSLKHNPADEYLVGDDYTVNVKNFVVEVRFYNPYAGSQGQWDCGLILNSSDDKEFRLVLTSYANWELYQRKSGGGRDTVYADEKVRGLDSNEGGSNLIRFVRQGDRGWFYLNDAIVTEVDLFSWPASFIEISAATELYNESGKAGAVTQYNDFYIWSLP